MSSINPNISPRQTGSHDAAEALAADTALPIREGGRRILRAIAGREKP